MFLTSNPKVTMDIIEENLNLNWCWYHIALNPNLTINFITARVALA